jgi:Putative DNA-binding domain
LGDGVTSLAFLQRFVSDAIRRRSSNLDSEVDGRISELIAPSTRGMSPADRIEIYREQFWLRHISNLEEDYPTLGWVLGAAAFREVAADYLQAFPPRSWNLERLGQDLPSFLVFAQPSPSALACDAAQLDWAFMEAFGALDAPPFDDSVLAAAAEDTWPSARILFHPSVRALGLSYPVQSLRDSVQRRESPQRPPPRESHVVVWRDPASYLRSVVVERNAFELLRALMAGVPLGAACERVATSGGDGADADEIGRHIARWFQEWRANAWLSAVHFG